MAKMEVGEYVRTKSGSIDKVINPNYYMSIYVECEKGMYLLDNVVKQSKQLEDLIEINDIVNGYRILGIYEAIESNDERILDIGYGMAIFNDQIKTILTKEQFLANCYKVGGEDEC